MITDVAGVNDQSFNQSAWEGLQRAEKELGIKVKYLESNARFRLCNKYRNIS